MSKKRDYTRSQIFVLSLKMVGGLLFVLAIGIVLIVLLEGDRALGLRLTNIWAASLASLLTYLGGYLYGSGGKDEDTTSDPPSLKE